MLRPTDLVWRYWVNNYLEGKPPPAFDVLFWNADTTRMAAALHRDIVMLGVHNSLATTGEVTMLGTPVDLKRLTLDTYVVAGMSPHFTVAGLLTQRPAARQQRSSLHHRPASWRG